MCVCESVCARDLTSIGKICAFDVIEQIIQVFYLSIRFSMEKDNKTLKSSVLSLNNYNSTYVKMIYKQSRQWNFNVDYETNFVFILNSNIQNNPSQRGTI